MFRGLSVRSLRRRLECRRFGHAFFAPWDTEIEICERCGKRKRSQPVRVREAV
jgi:hypothetical protein